MNQNLTNLVLDSFVSFVVLLGMSNSNFPNFFLSPPHHSLLAMEKKSTQLHTLIDFHSNFGQALRWVPATYAPPAFNLIT